MIIYKFDEKINCQTCRHGWYAGDFDLFCAFCGAYRCYMCTEKQGECPDYEPGDIPEGKERI